jgi:hypothetical protein
MAGPLVVIGGSRIHALLGYSQVRFDADSFNAKQETVCLLNRALIMSGLKKGMVVRVVESCPE